MEITSKLSPDYALGFKERPAWVCVQKIELFFHYKGTGNIAQEPNWFHYWSQVSAPESGTGNLSGMIFRLGEKWKWSHATYGQPSVITTHLASADPSLADFIGMVAHEQKHENDYFDVIWQGQGYIKTGDTDSGGIGDWIRDEWEKTAGRWKATYDYTDDRGGWGDDSKTEQFYFETDVTNFAWSDVRADDAAKRAVDANPEINQEDWSDLKVRPLQYEYKSTTGSPNPKRFVFRTTETCRNNKNFKPEEVQP